MIESGQHRAVISTPETRWLLLSRPVSSAAVRVFCCPHAGANAHAYGKWLKFLPDSVELLRVQLPGRGIWSHAELLTRMEPLVEALGAAILAALDRPYVLFGHSFGALLAFEIARKLSRNGIAPAHLFVFGRNAPTVPSPGRSLHRLSDEQLLQELERTGGTAREALANEELMRIMLPILRADLEICETYLYRADHPLTCPITAMGGSADEEVTLDGLKAWLPLTRGRSRAFVVPGNHFSVQPGDAAFSSICTELKTITANLAAGNL